MHSGDAFSSLLSDSKINTSEDNFFRTLQALLSQVEITDVPGEVASDLYRICCEYVLIYCVAAKAKNRSLKPIFRRRKRLISDIEKHISALTIRVTDATPSLLSAKDKEFFDRAIKRLSDAVGRVEPRWRAEERMVEAMRKEPFPGGASPVLNDYLRLSHGKRWPQQQQRNQIICACLQAAKFYKKADGLLDPHQVETQLYRSRKKQSPDTERIVYTPDGLRRRAGWHNAKADR